MSKDSKAIQQAQIFSFHPTGEYYFAKGLKYFHRRDLHKAKKYMERAYELEAGEPMIACQLAIVCTELGEYEHSNELLQTILSGLDPFMTECHYFLANNYAHLGMFKEAYKHVNDYLDKEEDGEFSDDAEELIDLIAFEMDETGESLEYLDQQDGLIFKQEKAREQLETGNFAKAIETLSEIVKEYPEFWSAYNNLALAHFYLGKTDEAFNVLDEVLEKNPGNLYALCNQLVFHHYQKNAGKVAEITAMLEKIRPIMNEQRFKLGATFAMTGQYEQAYKWLKLLQKKGFDHDGTFYYWLADSAYHLGHTHTAEQAWKRVLSFNPEKEGMEPWKEAKEVSGFEDHYPSIMKRLESDLIEERLFGIFLTKHSIHQKRVSNHDAFTNNKKFDDLEKEYSRYIRSSVRKHSAGAIHFADHTADLLLSHYRPIKLTEAGVFLMWFTVAAEAYKRDIPLKNVQAHAASIDFIWHRLRNEPMTQKEAAEKYGVSTATLRKYIQSVNDLLV
ncbi:tetratricopeptide repeat protein [Peribacillus deserti]|uniref:Tetratricopeptide repeat protein n=1 Tax=Peribacillus deserti TaxID=673318 RepID=A0A2N5M3T5_9BACI|nr:tetratricopeptide repeat protein [Peribacillus deserti]PLT29029.1 tetratricopeptide repeat protein [Peribacillus deserti]